MFYTDIHLRKFADNSFYFQKKKKIAATAIVMVSISIILFRGNSSSESSF